MNTQKKWATVPTKSILNNLESIFKSGDSSKMTKATYNFLYLMSGFIAHYNQGGFMDYYADVRDLLNDILRSSDIGRPDYYREDFFTGESKELQADYYISKAETYKQLKPLAEKYQAKVNIDGLEKEKADLKAEIQAKQIYLNNLQ